MNDTPETTQYDVNLPKPRPHKVLIGVLVTVLVLGVIGVAAAAIVNRTAQNQSEATAAVMPPNTTLYFSLNTQASQLPNFNAVADAWKDSKEARMLASGLELALTQAGLNWEEDVQPWLGERLAVGLVDLGGVDQTAAQDAAYRPPFFVVAAQTKDRAKSDAALSSMLKQLSQTSGKSTRTESYRGIPITYLDLSDSAQASLAVATINDVIALTLGSDHMQAVVNAALDGQNLAGSANYKAVMSALSDQNAGAMYMDYGQYMEAVLEMNKGMLSTYDRMLSNMDTAQANEFKQQREKMLAQQEAQMAQLREVMKAMGGIGVTMAYEPTGIRFDTAVQYDPAQLPADQRQMYESALTPASGKIFAALPASTILAADFSLKGGFLKAVLNPDVLATQFAALGVSKEDFATKLDQAQKLIGVNLQTDIVDLLNGDAGLAIALRDQQKSDLLAFSSPIEFALLLDASDANKLMASVDKVLQSLSALNSDGSLQVQSLSGLPYSVLMIDEKPVVTYGVVDGRFVIGTDSNTLLGIDNADQSSLANDPTFKQATGLLPGNRLNTAYLSIQPLWNLIDTEVMGDAGSPAGTGAAAVLNYLKHFKWISTGAEAPANGLSRGSMHIGVGQ